MNKKQDILDYFNGFNYHYKLNDAVVPQLYDLMFNNNVPNDPYHCSAEFLMRAGLFYYTKNLYDDALKFFLVAIDKDEPIAMYNLGVYYHTIKDNVNMIKYLDMASMKGCTDAMNRLGRYYWTIGDYSKMAKYLDMAVNKGSLAAMNYLGNFYKRSRNFVNMKKYFNMAIQRGCIKALFNYGVFFGEIRDYPNMINLFQKACGAGYIEAMYSLGLYYQKICNHIEMKKYYEMAIDKGCSASMHNLGTFYRVNGDFVSMKKYYLMAIAAGNEKSLANLIIFYKESKDYDSLIQLCLTKKDNLIIMNDLYNFLLKNFSDSVVIIAKYIDHMNIDIKKKFFNHYGFTYMSSVDPDKQSKLIAYFKDTDITKTIVADHNIELIYDIIFNDYNPLKSKKSDDYDGNYYAVLADHWKIKGDLNKAKDYYLLAIEKGDCQAMNNLAAYYSEIKDYDNMIKYYLMAIHHKSIDAMYNLAVYYRRSSDFDNMFKYLNMALDNNYHKAMLMFAIHYQNIGDKENMIKYYLMAIERGNEDAFGLLLKYCDDNNDIDIKLKMFVAKSDIISLNDYILKNYDKCLPYISKYIDRTDIDRTIKQKFFKSYGFDIQ